MPLAKQRNRERMRVSRASKKEGGTLLLSKSLVKKMRRLGLNPLRIAHVLPVSLNDYRDLQRRYAAKVERVEWQSGGIRMLRDEIATLKALLATQPAMQDTTVLQRLTQLEADQALRDADHTWQST